MSKPHILFFAVKTDGRLLTLERGNYLGLPFWENPAGIPLIECARRAIDTNALIINLGEPTFVCRYEGEWNGIVSDIEVHAFHNAHIYAPTKIGASLTVIGDRSRADIVVQTTFEALILSEKPTEQRVA